MSKSQPGLSINCTAVNSSNYSQVTYRSQIAVGLWCSMLLGEESVADNATDKVLLRKQVNYGQHSYREPHVHNNDYKQYGKKEWESPTKAEKREAHTQEPAVSSGYRKPTYAVLVGQTVTV